MEARTCLCDSFLHCQSLPRAYLLSQTQISPGWIIRVLFFFFFFFKGRIWLSRWGEKIIYKDMKKVEALQNFHIVSGIRTRSISTWIKPIIFLTVFPNRQQDADLAALCILSQWHRTSGATTGEAGGPHVLMQALPFRALLCAQH